MPIADIDGEVRKVWTNTVTSIKEDKSVYPKMSESNICHVRPHARDKDDTIETPSGKMEVKKCFWLNRQYIKDQVVDKVLTRNEVLIISKEELMSLYLTFPKNYYFPSKVFEFSLLLFITFLVFDKFFFPKLSICFW